MCKNTVAKDTAINSLCILTRMSPILVSYFKNSKLNFTSITFVLYQRQISSPVIAIVIAAIINRVATPFIHLKVKEPEKKRTLSKK